MLLSAKDGSVVRDLTSGFDKDLGFDHIVQVGERWNTVPWMSWSPKGDRLAYFVRTEKERTLIVQNVLNRNIEQRIPMKSVDEPESPCFSPLVLWRHTFFMSNFSLRAGASRYAGTIR